MIKHLTKQGLEKLKKELSFLEKVKRKKVSERLNQAIAQGDLRENAAYDSAKEEQGFVEARIKELKKILSEAKIIKKKKTENAEIGSFVLLKSGKEEEKFQIVGPEEADVLNGKISFESPLGKAILGKKKGDFFEIESPGGLKKYQIIKVD